MQDVHASIESQVLATDIISRVAMKASDKELLNIYQIPNRYMLLSSALDAAGYSAESLAALVLAIWSIIESSPPSSNESNSDSHEAIEADSTSGEILLFPENAVQDNFPHDSLLARAISPIIKKLIRTYIEHRNPSSNKESRDKNPTKDSCAHIPKDTLMEEVLVVASVPAGEREGSSHLKDIQLWKLLDCALWNKSHSDRVVSTAEKLILIREVLKSTVKIAKSNVVDDDVLVLHIMEELDVFLQTQKTKLRGLVGPDSLRDLMSSLHVLFAGQMVESRLLYFPRASSWASCQSSVNMREYKLLLLTCIQLDLAEKQFAAADLNESIFPYACHCVKLAALQLHLGIFSEHLSLAELSDDFRATIASDAVPSRTKQIQSVMGKYTLTLGTCR